MQYEYKNYDRSVIAATDPETGHVTILEPGVPGWGDAVAAGPAEFVAGPDPLELAVERAGMVVSRFQARAALHLAGLLGDVEAALEAGGSPLARLAWADATEFRRDSPTIAELAGALELDDETLDALFRTAATIKA